MFAIEDTETPSYYHRIFRENLIKMSKNTTWNLVKNEWKPTGVVIRCDEGACCEDHDTSARNQSNQLDESLIGRGSVIIQNQRPSSHCICSHPIIDNCEIENVLSNIKIYVGNCCVKHLSDEEYERIKKITTCVKKLDINEESFQVNPETILNYQKLNILSEKEATFLTLNRKRKDLLLEDIKYLTDIKIKILTSYHQSNIDQLYEKGIIYAQCHVCKRDGFMEFDEDPICFQCYKSELDKKRRELSELKKKRQLEENLSDERINQSLREHIINQKEWEFLKDIRHRTKLTEKQLQWKKTIETKIKNPTQDETHCQCGRFKKSNFRTCWTCHQNYLNQLLELQTSPN